MTQTSLHAVDPERRACPHCGSPTSNCGSFAESIIDAEIDDQELFGVGATLIAVVVALAFAWRDVTSTAIATTAGLLAIGVLGTRWLARCRAQKPHVEAPVASGCVAQPETAGIPVEAISSPADKQTAAPQIVTTSPVHVVSEPIPDSAALNSQELERRRRETADVQQRLAAWAAQPASVISSPASESPQILDELCELLDEDFRQFARAIWTGPHPWVPAAFAALAHSHGVMPNDGFDRINAAAIALTGERLLEEVDGRIQVATGATNG